MPTVFSRRPGLSLALVGILLVCLILIFRAPKIEVFLPVEVHEPPRQLTVVVDGVSVVFSYLMSSGEGATWSWIGEAEDNSLLSIGVSNSYYRAILRRPGRLPILIIASPEGTTRSKRIYPQLYRREY